MKNLYILLISLSIASCTYNEVKQTIFKGYYDDAKTQLQVEGEVLDGLESGLWKYYDERGQLIKEGNYSSGLQSGLWTYHNQGENKEISWKPHKGIVNNFEFSTPDYFEVTSIDKDSSSYTLVSKINNDVLSLKDCGKSSLQDLKSFFVNTKELLSNDYIFLDYNSMIAQLDSNKYYIDEFKMKNKKNSKEILLYNYYTLINDNILLLSYKTSDEDSVASRFLIEEIFYHTNFKGKRIIKPLLD